MKKTLLSLFVIGGLVMISDSFSNKAFTWSGQGPDGKTGSPGDGSTCASSCHSTTDVAAAQFVMDSIPSSGYVPGTTYLIGFGGTTGFHSKYGFQASPQDLNGNLLGTLSAGVGSKISSDKYATHDGAFNGAIGGWTFYWTAPTAGTGDVTFYGAMIAANGDGQASGDQGLTGTATVSEDTGNSIANENINTIAIFPTLADDFINVNNAMNESFTIYGMNGQLVKAGLIDAKSFKVDLTSVQSGMYFVKVRDDIQKIIIK